MVSLVVGQTGVGKSHIAQALGHRACMRGFNVLYTSAQAMFQQLRASRADASYERKLLRYTSLALLIVDDLGLRPLIGDEPGSRECSQGWTRSSGPRWATSPDL